MIHPDTTIREAGRDVGLGVFATRRIPRGTIVWARDELDICLSLDEARAMSRPYRRLLDRYGFLDRSGRRIVCWDLGRFVNHTCDPNVLPTPWGLEIAIRTIRAGEQITNDYATLNLERPFRCLCGHEGCRGTVRPGDFERLVGSWDRELREALPSVIAVRQPLLPWLDTLRRRELRRAARRPELTPSLSTIRLQAAITDPAAFAAVPRRKARPRLVEAGSPGPVPGDSPTARAEEPRVATPDL